MYIFLVSTLPLLFTCTVTLSSELTKCGTRDKCVQNYLYASGSVEMHSPHGGVVKRIRAHDSSCGVSYQQSVGLSPSRDTCVKQDTIAAFFGWDVKPFN